mgnify:CR=1 FL=1
MDTLGLELKQAWNSITFLSLALIVSAWTIGVFGISFLLDSDDEESLIKKPRTPFLKSHVV